MLHNKKSNMFESKKAKEGRTNIHIWVFLPISTIAGCPVGSDPAVWITTFSPMHTLLPILQENIQNIWELKTTQKKE